MIRLKFSIDLRYEITDFASDFIFNIHAAHTHCQTVVTEALQLSQPVTPVVYIDPTYGSRYMRLRAEPAVAARSAAVYLSQPLLPIGPAVPVRDPRVRSPGAGLLARAGDP